MAAGARVHREPLILRPLPAAALAALVLAAGAGAAPNPKKTVTGWIDALAMNGPNVAYSAENASNCRNVVVWNVLTGRAELISGPKAGTRCGDDEPNGQRVGELAIGDTQVAWTRTVEGNTEADDRLFAASLSKPREHSLAAARRVGEPPIEGGCNLVFLPMRGVTAAVS